MTRACVPFVLMWNNHEFGQPTTSIAPLPTLSAFDFGIAVFAIAFAALISVHGRRCARRIPSA